MTVSVLSFSYGHLFYGTKFWLQELYVLFRDRSGGSPSPVRVQFNIETHQLLWWFGKGKRRRILHFYSLLMDSQKKQEYHKRESRHTICVLRHSTEIGQSKMGHRVQESFLSWILVREDPNWKWLNIGLPCKQMNLSKEGIFLADFSYWLHKRKWCRIVLLSQWRVCGWM